MLMEVSGSQFWEKSSEGNQIRERKVCELIWNQHHKTNRQTVKVTASVTKAI